MPPTDEHGVEELFRTRYLEMVRLRTPAARHEDSSEQAVLLREDHREVLAALAGLPARGDRPALLARPVRTRDRRGHGRLAGNREIVREPRHGGITVAHGKGFTWTAYLVDGRVSFWSGRWLLAYSALPASGPTEVSVFFDVLGGAIPGPSGFYGYAHDDIARVTVRLASGRLLTARTFPGWPGSGLRLWVAPVPSGLHQAPKYVALGYDSAGHLVWQATHG